MKAKMIEEFEKLPDTILQMQIELINLNRQLNIANDAIGAIEETELQTITEAIDPETQKPLHSNETKRRLALKQQLGIMPEYQTQRELSEKLKNEIQELQVKTQHQRDVLRVYDTILRIGAKD